MDLFGKRSDRFWCRKFGIHHVARVVLNPVAPQRVSLASKRPKVLMMEEDEDEVVHSDDDYDSSSSSSQLGTESESEDSEEEDDDNENARSRSSPKAKRYKYQVPVILEEDGNPGLSCRICGKFFSNNFRLKRHEANHGPKNVTCERPGCSYAGSSAEQLTRHHRNIHFFEDLNVTETTRECPICKEVLKRYRDLKHHLLVHDRKQKEEAKPQKKMMKKNGPAERSDCPYCPEVTDTPLDELEVHVKDQHNKQAPFECGDCDKKFPSPDILMSHKAKFHIPATCDICGLSLPNNHRLKTHLQTHREESFVCQQCGFACKSYRNLTIHVALKHADACEKTCDVCGQKFTSRKQFQIHEVSHLERQFKCQADGCIFAAASANELKKHKRHIYKGPDGKIGSKSEMDRQKARNECPYCVFGGPGSGVDNKELLEHLEKVHNVTGPYPCRECGKVCLRPGSLVLHNRTHAETVCELCGTSVKVYAMRRHLVQKHPNAAGKDGKPVGDSAKKKLSSPCPYCEFETGPGARVQVLLDHIKAVHHEVAPFPCRSCDKKCSRPAFLVRHQIMHTKSMCEHCGAAFTIQDMKKHLALKHGITSGDFNHCSCVVEGCSFAGERQQLAEHMKTAHKKTDLYFCVDCKTSVDSRAAFLKHCLEVHGIEEPLKCQICSKDFSFPQDLAFHNRQCRKDNSIPTLEGGKSSFSEIKHSMYNDLVNEGAELSEWKCTFEGCDFVTYRGHRLRKHMLEEHDVYEVFRCQDCDFQTKEEDALVHHSSSVHMNSKPFSCDLCGKAFPSAGGVLRHKRMAHNWEKEKYSCSHPGCQETFSSKGSRKLHEKTHSGNEESRRPERDLPGPSYPPAADLKQPTESLTNLKYGPSDPMQLLFEAAARQPSASQVSQIQPHFLVSQEHLQTPPPPPTPHPVVSPDPVEVAVPIHFSDALSGHQISYT